MIIIRVLFSKLKTDMVSFNEILLSVIIRKFVAILVKKGTSYKNSGNHEDARTRELFPHILPFVCDGNLQESS